MAVETGIETMYGDAAYGVPLCLVRLVWRALLNQFVGRPWSMVTAKREDDTRTVGSIRQCGASVEVALG